MIRQHMISLKKNIQDLGVVADNMNQEIRLLSGGNQQKIVIAKMVKFQS